MRQVSFEYFPGRSEKAKNALENTVRMLAEYQPEFQSVTFGAGGSSKEGTFETLQSVERLSRAPAACHLTYSGMSRKDVVEFADTLWNAGVRRLVALRGDAEETGETAPFEDTAAFVHALMREHPFEIAVSCYPEVHPKAADANSDLQVLKEKQIAGAKLAISQFFFDNQVFYDFVARARANGVTLPIVPGILPIYNFERVKEMAAQCGTHIPQFVHDAFDGAKTSGSDPMEVAAELLKAQVQDLAYAGYEAIHIYTLNKPQLAAIAADAFVSADAHNTVVQFRQAS